MAIDSGGLMVADKKICDIFFNNVSTVLLLSSVLIYTKSYLKCITKCSLDKTNNRNKTMYAIAWKVLN